MRRQITLTLRQGLQFLLGNINHVDLMHKWLLGTSILINGNLRIVISHLTNNNALIPVLKDTWSASRFMHKVYVGCKYLPSSEQ